MSKSYSSLREDLIRTSNDKEYRHAYAEESLNLSVATQIKVLREQRELTQEALARAAEMKQSMISRYENVNYSSWSINTLRKLAEAFDVFLDVRYRSFRELVETTERFSREALQVPAFMDDPFFKEEQPLVAQTQTQAGIGIITLFAAVQNSGFAQKVYTGAGSASSAALDPRTHMAMMDRDMPKSLTV